MLFDSDSRQIWSFISPPGVFYYTEAMHSFSTWNNKCPARYCAFFEVSLLHIGKKKKIFGQQGTSQT